MITVAETGEFIRKARKLLTDAEHQELVQYVSANPLAGALMEGTGGIRKIRWARHHKGKSGGVRAIYFFHHEGMPLYMLTIYGKGEKDNISASERNELRNLVELLVAFWTRN